MKSQREGRFFRKSLRIQYFSVLIILIAYESYKMIYQNILMGHESFLSEKVDLEVIKGHRGSKFGKKILTDFELLREKFS